MGGQTNGPTVHSKSPKRAKTGNCCAGRGADPPNPSPRERPHPTHHSKISPLTPTRTSSFQGGAEWRTCSLWQWRRRAEGTEHRGRCLAAIRAGAGQQDSLPAASATACSSRGEVARQGGGAPSLLPASSASATRGRAAARGVGGGPVAGGCGARGGEGGTQRGGGLALVGGGARTARSGARAVCLSVA